MFEIQRDYKFSAGHYLPDHDGQCAFPHGHNYKVTVAVVRPQLIDEPPQTGMVWDFARLDQIVRPIIDRMDHRTLSKGPGLSRELYYVGWPEYLFCDIGATTTAENIALWLLEEIDDRLCNVYDMSVRCASVAVEETDRNVAIYSNPNL